MPPPQRDREDVRVARLLFYGGCLLLPWLWAANLLFFRRQVAAALCGARAGSAGGAPASPELLVWLRRSGAGLALISTIFAAWIGVFQSAPLSFLSLIIWQQDWRWWGDTLSLP